MSHGPRIVFTRFLSGDSPKLVPWVAHVRQVTAGRAGETASADLADTAIVWQLVSANNRHLARSVAVHPSFEAAVESARGIVAASDDLEVELVSQPSRGSYGWFATSDEGPVLSCARWYVTPRDRQHSISLALKALRDAELQPGVRHVHHAHEESAPELSLA